MMKNKYNVRDAASLFNLDYFLVCVLCRDYVVDRRAVCSTWTTSWYVFYVVIMSLIVGQFVQLGLLLGMCSAS